MSNDQLMSNAHLVPDSAIEAIAKQVLGSRLFLWSKQEGGKMCVIFERQRAQLMTFVNDIQVELDNLETGDFEIPLTSKGEPVMSEESYKQSRKDYLQASMASNINSLDKLTTIYLKLTAGGLGAMLSGMKQAREIEQDRKTGSEERNATPVRRYGAGRALVVDVPS